ncbi:uncharacterized protein B0I36DRAFT_165664 [Microdochium trichocladiopsis]|uniref:Uncharacterized protein n=1 Tax=Microdochium trichocladiopsis TaxID=1682393 RepID=A0A9P8XY92_9PEZI|nr:uncharacterized protein B0I36DRAFT_165664 [Microdochium trichocladiopsis]KAH7025023.1 hypothetical protein B0I36DRAFT_165664 [Microdochium trichocladiopsis]
MTFVGWLAPAGGGAWASNARKGPSLLVWENAKHELLESAVPGDLSTDQIESTALSVWILRRRSKRQERRGLLLLWSLTERQPRLSRQQRCPGPVGSVLTIRTGPPSQLVPTSLAAESASVRAWPSHGNDTRRNALWLQAGREKDWTKSQETTGPARGVPLVAHPCPLWPSVGATGTAPRFTGSFRHARQWSLPLGPSRRLIPGRSQ